MSSDNKNVGHASFCCTSIVSMAAWICGLTATAYCSFVQRNIGFASTSDLDQLCSEIGQAQCDTMAEDHGVGFYGWQTTVGVPPEVVCMSYTQYIANKGIYVTPDFDINFNMARVSSYIADIFGGFAVFTLLLSACCPISEKRLALLSCCFFIACLFQGFTLLVFQSSACDKGFFANAYFGNTTLDLETFEVSCSLDTGSNLAISATVMYFVAMIAVQRAIPPKPIGGGADMEIEPED